MSSKSGFIAIIGAFFALAMGCKVEDPFPAYSGVDLISGIHFDKQASLQLVEPDIGADPLDVSAKWDWAWRGITGDAPLFNYMSLAASAEPGPDGSTAYELENANLFINGTFDATLDMANGWDTAPPGTSITKVYASDSNAINGLTLWIHADPKKYAGFKASGLINPLVVLPQGRAFLIHLLAKGGANYQYADPASPLDTASPYSLPVSLDKATIREDLLASVSTDVTPFRLIFGNPSDVTDCYIDEMRAIRFDTSKLQCFRLRLRRTDTTLPLVAGYYEFNFRIKKPTDRRFADDTGTEAYAAPRVYAELRQLDEEGHPFVRASNYATPDASWQAVSLTGTNFDILHGDDEKPIMGIAIYIIAKGVNALILDSGSVLIADPRLLFYSQGYN